MNTAKFAELDVILPGHGLEDFPTHLTGDEAEGMLVACVALWHPALLVSAQQPPRYLGAVESPEPGEGSLVILSDASLEALWPRWPNEAEERGAKIVGSTSDRAATVAAVLEAAGVTETAVDSETLADFQALGFAHLMIELLTHRMRYTSHLDEEGFRLAAVSAAEAAIEGRHEDMHSHLVRCFDLLSEARDQFYPVEVNVIDLTLVASTTIGPALRTDLEHREPTNLLISGQVVEQMAAEHPETLAELKSAIASGTACLVGGEYCENELPLLPIENVRDNFLRGREVYEQHLGHAPEVYGRRRFGLTPMLPQLLARLGYVGALHFTLDGGKFPTGYQARACWNGYGGTSLDIVTRIPRDATKVESFLELPEALGDSMDHDHVATICLAHWPGQASPWSADLKRIARFGTVLGKYVMLSEYFSSTDGSDMQETYGADEYHSPYLVQDVASGSTNPLSKHVAAHNGRQQQEVASALRVITSAAGRDSSASDEVGSVLTGTCSALGSETTEEQPTGALVINPASYKRRMYVERSDLAGIDTASEHAKVAGHRDGAAQCVVDLPAMGFAYLKGIASSKEDDKGPPLAEEHTLRNEHFEVNVDETTGAIRSIRHHGRRTTLFSGQIAYRAPSPLGRATRKPPPEAYSVMAADSVEITDSTRAMGSITSKGRLLDREGGVLANFEQRLELWRGSHVLLVDITLDPQVTPGDNPWDSYFAFRSAWPEEAAILRAWHGGSGHSTNARRIESPGFVEIAGAKDRAVVLSGGLPYHQLSGPRVLDTLLIVKGEQARSFRLGVGIDVDYPVQAAANLLSPEGALACSVSKPPVSEAGWLYHVTAKNLIATHWEPTAEGFLVRLQEAAGRSGTAKLSAAREIGTAAMTDFLGRLERDLPTEGGAVIIDFSPHQWFQIEARWA